MTGLKLGIHDRSTPNGYQCGNLTQLAWRERLDMQPVPISVIPFGLKGHKCRNGIGVGIWKVLGVRSSPRKLEKASEGVEDRSRIDLRRVERS
ncbi:hypothetical protein AVEN_169873-1 [Araneus ventricosus]|uniref:Uncharacterized protein n=1 Tax=Araneus ventricosus TaxID=182803 RepID=A0A4Y2L9N1_ARAVE|nr:hypothetical protein AVEN_169873-1 [Araneus ventricosus]